MSLACRFLRHAAQSTLFKEIVIDSASVTLEGLLKLRAQLCQLDRLNIRCEKLTFSSRTTEGSSAATLHSPGAHSRASTFGTLLQTLLLWKNGPSVVHLQQMLPSMETHVLANLWAWQQGPNVFGLSGMRLSRVVDLRLPALAARWIRETRIIFAPRMNQSGAGEDWSDDEQDFDEDEEDEAVLQVQQMQRALRRREREQRLIDAFRSLKLASLQAVEVRAPMSCTYASSHYFSNPLFSCCTSLIVSRHLVTNIWNAMKHLQPPADGWPIKHLIVEELPDIYLPDACFDGRYGLGYGKNAMPEQMKLVSALTNLVTVQLIATPSQKGSSSGLRGFPFDGLSKKLVNVTLSASSWESPTFEATVLLLTIWLRDLRRYGVGKLKAFRFSIAWPELEEAFEEDRPGWSISDYEDLRREHPELLYPTQLSEEDDEIPLDDQDFLDEDLARMVHNVLAQMRMQKWKREMLKHFAEIKDILNALPIRHQIDMPAWDTEPITLA